MSLQSILHSLKSGDFRSLTSQKTILLVGLLIGLTFLAFSPVLKAQFLNEKDPEYLTQNLNVLTFDGPHIQALLKSRIEGQHIPLSSLAFSFEHHTFGLNSFVFHLNNLLLHIAVVVLVFFFARNLGLSPIEAFLGALIFALHPTKVESVAWVSQRKDMLYALFVLASLVGYQKGKFWLSLIFCFLGMLANPIALFIPFIMVLIDWFYGKGIGIKIILSKWPYFLIVGLIGYSTYLVHAKTLSFNIVQSPLVWIWSFVFYIEKFFFPVISVPDYVLPKPINFFSVEYIFSLVLFCLIVLGVFLKRNNKWIVFSFLFYGLSIIAVLPIDQVEGVSSVADHDLYFPSLGFCLLIAIGVLRLYQFLKTQEAIIRHLFSASLVVLITGLILLTLNQSAVWHDTVTLWEHQVKTLPTASALNNLARALIEEKVHQSGDKNYSDVIKLYKRAIAMDAQDPAAYYHLAQLYKNTGQLNESLAWYNKALTIDKNNKEALLGLGLLYQELNNPQESISILKRLLKIDPDDESSYIKVIDAYSKAIAAHPQEKLYQEQREEVLSDYEELSKRKKYSAADYFNLAFLYEQIGGFDEAVRFYKKSLEINPSYEKSLLNLANRYQEMGEIKTALILYQHLVHFHPRSAQGYLKMGIIYNGLGDVDRARMLYQKTIDVDPNNAGAYFNLGYLNESTGNLKEALNSYEKALENDPQLSEGYYNIGNVYAALGQIPEAIASYLKTVSINKNHQNAYVNLSILSFKSRDFPGAIRYLEQAQALGYTPPAEYLKSLEPYKKK